MLTNYIYALLEEITELPKTAAQLLKVACPCNEVDKLR